MANFMKIAKVGAGTPILFIHGWGLNSGVWQPCVEQLQAQFEVQTVDLPGFGINVDVMVSPYSLENIARSIIEIMDKPSFVVGWSLGGMVATEIALQAPNKVKGLITVASTPCFIEKDRWAWYAS